MHSNDYAAQAFAPGLPGGKASGRLKLTHDAVHFESDKGSVDLPLAGIRIRVGGASDRLVFFEHTGHENISLYTAEKAVLKDPRLASHPALTASLKTARAQSRKKLWIGLSILGVLAALPIALILSWGAVVAFAASNVPLDWERTIGESVLEEFAQAERVQLDALDSLAGVLANAVRDERNYQFSFYVVEDETMNAFAAPGGIVVVHTGLIEKAQSGEELLGVLAHEIAHVTEQHGMRGMINSLGWLIVIQATLGDASGLAGILVQSAPFFIHQQYSQGFEADADERAVDLMQRAGVDPSGLTQFFERLIQERDPAIATVKDSLSFLSSHPATQDRIDAINALIESQPGRYESFDKDFTKLRNAVQSWQEDRD